MAPETTGPAVETERLMTERGTFARAFVLALLAEFAVLFAVIGLWMLNLRLGPPIEGFAGGPLLAAVPLLLLTLGIVWIALRFGMRRSVNWTPVTVAAAAAGFGFVAIAFSCGPTACFAPGENRLLGWFVVGGIVLAALAHHWVYVRFAGETSIWE
jgi:hypothetical protein